MLERIREILTTDVPFNYIVSIERVTFASGWNSKTQSEHLETCLRNAVNSIYNTKPLFIGWGGAIPFAGILGSNFPNSDFLVTGASLPDWNGHGPNENLDLVSLLNLTSALGLLFSKY